MVGGGTAGIGLAAARTGVGDIAHVEPANQHYHQPLWTLVAGRQASAATPSRSKER